MTRVGFELAFPVVEIISHPRLKIHYVWRNQICLCEIFGFLCAIRGSYSSADKDLSILGQEAGSLGKYLFTFRRSLLP
jgi:hypothetical protein